MCAARPLAMVRLRLRRGGSGDDRRGAPVGRDLTFSRNLAFSALVLLAGFMVLPRIVFGSAYADMRLAPFLIATALLAIRFRGETAMPTARVLAWLGLGFYLLRIAATTLSLALAANDQ